MSTSNSPSTSKRRGAKPLWRKALPLVIGAFVLFLIVSGMRPKPVEVEAGSVSTQPLTVTVLEEGKTRIRHRYVISPPIAGFLNRIELRPGARVEKGKTVLASIRPAPASFLDPRARSEAEARLKAAEAAKKRSDETLERSRASLDLAGKEKTRADELKKRGVIAAKDWDAAENQVQILGRELRAAEFAVQVSEFEVAQASAALEQTQSVDTGNVEPLQIIAPVDGYVLSVLEESERTVTPGLPLMEVGDPQDIEAEIELLSSDAVAVRSGAEVSIERWGGPRPLKGRVAVVEPGGYTKVSSLGVEEQRVKVRVNFVDEIPETNPLGDRFRVEARIVTWHGDNVLQVPTGALFRRGGDWMAFTIDGGKARAVKVEIDHNNGIAAQVLSGLKDGQLVILHPPDVLAEGMAVKVRKGE